jgi:hypothetical protein
MGNQLGRALQQPSTSRHLARIPVAIAAAATAAIGYCAGSSYREAFRDTDAFYRDFQAITGRPARQEEWDEWGHEYVACRTTERCGSQFAHVGGDSVEFLHELGRAAGLAQHDSFPEDVYAETLGRRRGEQQGIDCYLATLSDAAHGQLRLPSDRHHFERLE